MSFVADVVGVIASGIVLIATVFAVVLASVVTVQLSLPSSHCCWCPKACCVGYSDSAAGFVPVLALLLQPSVVHSSASQPFINKKLLLLLL